MEHLVVRVQNGEVEPYGQIVEAFQKPMYRYCSRLLGNAAEAEDAVQEILVKAYQNIGQYRPLASFSSWLYKIAYHHCLQVIRQRQRQGRLLTLLRPQKFAESPEQVMDRCLFDEPLAVALSRLKAEERNLLVLRIFEEQSFAEMAAILGKNTDAVKKRYRRTIVKLTDMLQAQNEGEEQWTSKSLLKKEG
ncbi:RNA polymerase sigma factor [Paenibacillus sp. MMS20-IR301]|uniref:RNA polymerase sigma factor n=1 Tax=Paenibacillus sp. MMS20-IR301 TaxID=2895946 RepID=UPI0028ED10A9|nr:RNA polymerase sigma factor [Paenibacillus sp. MMS20-IR301]WNS46989.1 RNA polymerase sigma factor [Paenibacillus sp. MMS20-IR301]